MNTSVFKGTMAEMSYPQIEAAIQSLRIWTAGAFNIFFLLAFMAISVI